MVKPCTRIGDRLPTVGCTRLYRRVKPRKMALVATMVKLQMKVFQLLLQLDRDGSLRSDKALLRT